MNVLERVMGWMKKPEPYHDPELEAAQRRLAKLEAAERRKALALRVDARRRPAR